MESVEKVERAVKKKFNAADQDYVGFHWFYPYHLKKVKEEAGKLLEHYPGADREITLIAALLHDAGYLIDHTRHEEVGFKAAEKVLEELNIELEEDQVEKLDEAITEHGYNGNPEIIEAKIVACSDALAHMHPDFFAAKSRVEMKNGKWMEEFQEWMKNKHRKDLEKAKLLPESKDRAEKLRFRF